MITFIICDDNKQYLVNNSQIINEVMMNNDYKYQIKTFDIVNKELTKVIETKGPKIYIIDLELKEKSGLDLINEIRKNDYRSPIIVSSSHDEMMARVFKSKNMILDFVSKYEMHNQNLKKILQKALQIIERSQIINYKQAGEISFLFPEDIIYIMKKNNSQGIIIKTENGKEEVKTSLAKFIKKVDKNFIQVHRSCIVNKRKIEKLDLKKGTIYFRNKVCLENIVSRNYKKNLEETKNDF